VTSLVGTEKCKEYNTNNYSKPIGLLQVYGETGQIQFGLMTGSYTKNISGGVLRKNVGTLANEVNTNGTFATPTGGSIITTLNRLRIWGYRYDDGTYIGGGTADNCGFQLTSITENNCVSWGNPMSEVYYESLRYFSGATAATSAFNTDDSSKISGLVTATWPSSSTTVLSNSNYCAPVNVLVFNASVSTNETDSQIGNPFTGLTFNAVTATSAVGTNEGITGSAKYFVGRTSATGSSTTTDNEYCDAKTQTGLGNMYGICPEGPTLAGSYLMAGLAHAAHTNQIRNDLTAVPSGDTRSLKVNTYGISLATNTPQISLKLAGSTTTRAVIQPAYRLNNTAPQGGGTLVDMQIVSQTTNTTSSQGKIYLNWEDSEQGGDYDQDMWGILTYCMQTGTDTTTCAANGGQANSISITTKAIAESTGQPQGFGYIISGTSKDGPHFHSGIEGFIYTDSTTPSVTLVGGGAAPKVNTSGGCQDCQVNETATTAVYSLSSTAPGSPLKDPLWYAAKYGGFKDLNADNLPNGTANAEWDVLKADGTTGSDGDPDNYFLVSNPLGLEKSLNTLFVSILATASASAAAANSSKLILNTKTYQAVFNTQDWSGKLQSFPVNSDGSLSTTADWDAGQQASLAAATATANQTNRVMLTYNKGVSGAAPRGVPFRWPSNPASLGTGDLSSTQVTSLKRNPTTSIAESDTIGQNRLLYIRGDATNEGTSIGDFRARPITKLGDIVNSNINYVGAPASGYADPTYAAFASTYASRTPMLYVGANDGMMHAFNANTGTELLSYVPSRLFRKLPQLTSQTYSHTYFVDGSPAVEDALLGTGSTAAWKTVLVGGYNSGGQGLYALNVTNPTTTNYAESNASNLVLWEFTDADDADLGYTYGDPIIAKMANGKWAAIISGGYNNSDSTSSDEVACTGGSGTTASPYTPAGCTTSRSGSAYLFVIFLDGPSGSNGTWVQGTDYIKIPTATVSAASAGTPNGLAAPFAVDITGDNMVDFVYAGDLFGNMWKFDLRSSSTATWTASTSVVNLFTALDASNNPQPVTTRPLWALHPSGSGFMVTFGTGKYMETVDVNSPFLTQTIYGIWDKNNGATVSAQTTVSGRSVLMQQKMLASSTSPRYRVLSKFVPNYTSANITYLAAQVASTDPNRPADTTTVTPQLGWYFDLSNTSSFAVGERVSDSPTIKNGVALYATRWPSANACLGAADGDNLSFNIGTGARTDFSVFDVNGNGVANSADFVVVNGVSVAVSSVAIVGGASQTPTFIRLGNSSTASGYGLPSSGGSQFTGIQSTSGGKLSQAIYSFGQDFGRISWREIISD
jgi:type IV pilus assembly protein PilY1